MTNIYLMTDGKPNGADSQARVVAKVNQWCSKKHPNTRLFYVVFTKNAKDPAIMNAVSACPDAFMVDCIDGKIPQLFDISNTVNANIEELHQTYKIECGMPGNMAVKAISNDPFFDVRVAGGKCSDYGILLEFTPRGNANLGTLHANLSDHVDEDGIYHFDIQLECLDSDNRIANPDVHVNMSDHLQASLSLGDGDNELEATEAVWHDKFLWSDATPNGKSIIDLQPEFRNAGANTRFRTCLVSTDGESEDYRYFFNGMEIAEGETFDIVPGEPAVLTIEYDNDAQTGKRYFSLPDCGSANLDIVNGKSIDDNRLVGIRSNYHTSMNPLALIFIIIGCILLAMLALWFIFIKRNVFRPIKVNRVIITGPDGYYQNKKIKGARKVVLTSCKQSQNFLCRWFTGRIIFVNGDFFNPEVVILAGRRKKVKLRSSDGWEYNPSSTVAQFETTTLINKDIKVGLEIQ